MHEQSEGVHTYLFVLLITEETGYDVSCIISCLVQLMLDPEYRTQRGFASLVQREWVVMGHPFQRRNRLVQGADSEQVSWFGLLTVNTIHSGAGWV